MGLLHSLTTACEKLDKLIEEAKAKVTTADDVPENMFRPAIAIYKDLYAEMDVKTIEAYEKKLISSDQIDGIQFNDLLNKTHINFSKKYAF